MRIAFVEDRYHLVYGAQENLLLLASSCRAAGHDVTLYTTSEGAFSEAARARGLAIVVVQAPDRLLRFERELLLGGVVETARTICAVAHYSWRLHRALRRDRVDLVIASAVRPTLLLVVTGLRRRPRVVLWAQNSTRLGPLADVAGALSWRIGLISDETRRTFGDRAWRFIGRRARALPSGRDFTRFDGRPRRRSTPTICIATIASITPRKGIHRLIRAVHRADLDDVRVVVVGGTTGPMSESYLAELRLEVEQLDVDAEFTGWLDDVVPTLHATDIFVLASEDEGLPGVLLEAMASGTACVTTNAGGAGELVERCGGGLVVEVGDDEALAAALRQLATDRAGRETFATAGAHNVRQLYGIDTMRRAIEAIIAEVAEVAEVADEH